MSSGGPRCSDTATPNQTTTRGRRVLLLRLAETTYKGLEGPTRKKGIRWWSRTKARGAGNPRPPLATLGSRDPAQEPRGRQPPAPPPLYVRRRRKRPLLTAHPQLQQLRYKAPRLGGSGGQPGPPRIADKHSELAAAFGHLSGWLPVRTAARAEMARMVPRAVGPKPLPQASKDQPVLQSHIWPRNQHKLMAEHEKGRCPPALPTCCTRALPQTIDSLTAAWPSPSNRQRVEARNTTGTLAHLPRMRKSGITFLLAEDVLLLDRRAS